jgi:hypothetical protein
MPEEAPRRRLAACPVGNYTIPDGTASIGDYAFNGCSSLTSIVIPASVTSIGNYAFSRCSSLTSVVIPASVTSIGFLAFAGTQVDPSSIPDTVTEYGKWFGSCPPGSNFTIPDHFTSIGYKAFYGCSSLTSVVIPASVTSIGERAFSGCSSLTSCPRDCPPGELSASNSTAEAGCTTEAIRATMCVPRGESHDNDGGGSESPDAPTVNNGHLLCGSRTAWIWPLLGALLVQVMKRCQV